VVSRVSKHHKKLKNGKSFNRKIGYVLFPSLNETAQLVTSQKTEKTPQPNSLYKSGWVELQFLMWDLAMSLQLPTTYI
jgi:hypothetical protein